jgi:ElaB/YqjD/DUF883 family membrane-anchored ribosome-binding protein
MAKKLSKFLAATAVLGAAVAGGYALLKKKQDSDAEKYFEEFDSEDEADLFGEREPADRKYFSLNINSEKIKNLADNVKDKASKATDVAKEKVNKLVEEGKIDDVRDTVIDFTDEASKTVKEVVKKATNFVKDASSPNSDSDVLEPDEIDLEDSEDEVSDSEATPLESVESDVSEQSSYGVLTDEELENLQGEIDDDLNS